MAIDQRQVLRPGSRLGAHDAPGTGGRDPEGAFESRRLGRECVPSPSSGNRRAHGECARGLAPRRRVRRAPRAWGIVVFSARDARPHAHARVHAQRLLVVSGRVFDAGQHGRQHAEHAAGGAEQGLDRSDGTERAVARQELVEGGGYLEPSDDPAGVNGFELSQWSPTPRQASAAVETQPKNLMVWEQCALPFTRGASVPTDADQTVARDDLEASRMPIGSRSLRPRKEKGPARRSSESTVMPQAMLIVEPVIVRG